MYQHRRNISQAQIHRSEMPSRKSGSEAAPVPHAFPNTWVQSSADGCRQAQTAESLGFDVNPAPGARVSIHDSGPAMVMCVEGVLDMLTAPTVTEHIDNVLRGTPQAVVIDLTGLEFLSAAGIEALAYTRRAAAAHTTKFAVVAVGRAVRHPLELSGIDRELAVFPTLSAALRHFTALMMVTD